MKNKEFVKYEQALALKELGFDERCFGHYNPNGVFFWKILCSDEDNDHTLSVKDIMEHVADGYVEAPLYQQAFRWFRDNHGLIGLVEGGYDNGKNIFTYVIWEGFKDNMIDEYFISYEEAEQACLDKLIQLLKDGK